MKTRQQIKETIEELDKWLVSKKLTTTEATMVLETEKLVLNMNAYTLLLVK